ncbi:hypothetical protein HK104_011175 [Borealophlyctis nickersoniae]|nr:hypothetical protein HK104_011175 [Borealophlyctis nickersoniae]
MKFATLLAAFALIGSAAAVANPEPATVVVKKKVVVYAKAQPAPSSGYTTRVEYRNGKKVVIVTKGAKAPAAKPAAPSSGYSTRVEYRNGKKVVIVTKGKTSSAPKTSYPTGQPSVSTWQGLALKLHNDARQAVNARYGTRIPMLTWSQTLSNGACYCSQLNANRDSLDHCGAGENLWKTSDQSISDYEAVKQTLFSWVQEEIGYYHPKSAISGSDPNFHKYGHYTQVVWDDTRRVGCCVRSGKFGSVVTCHYDPDGNFNHQSAY